MKVSTPAPVVLAALSVAGTFASNVENNGNSIQERQFANLPVTYALPDPAPEQLTPDQQESLDLLTKGLNGAASAPPLLSTGVTPAIPDLGPAPLPSAPVNSNLPSVASAPGNEAGTVAMLLKQNQQLIGLLSAYLPAQAVGAVERAPGVLPASIPGMLSGGFNPQLQQVQQQAYSPLANLAGQYGLPSIPSNLPLSNDQAWRLAAQAQSQLQNQLQNQAQGPTREHKDDHPDKHEASNSQDPAFNNGHPWANNLIYGKDQQVTSSLPLSPDALAKGLPTNQLSQNLPVGQASAFLNGLQSDQLSQNLPLAQAQGLAQGIYAGDQLGSLRGVANGVAGGQLGQGLPFAQAGNLVNGIAGGQAGQILPVGQASGLVKGVTNGQLPQGLPALPVAVPNTGSLLGSGGAGGLLGGLLGALNLQKQLPSYKAKHHASDAIRTGTDLLASATAYVQGGPTGAVKVPLKGVGHQLNQDADADDSESNAEWSSGATPTPTTRQSWSAPSLVRTASSTSRAAPPATSSAIAYSATPTWATSISAAKSYASAPSASPADSLEEDSDSDNANSKRSGAPSLRPHRREWVWVAPRHDMGAGHFLPRLSKRGGAANNAPHDALVSAKANLDPLLHQILPEGETKVKPTPTRTGDKHGKGATRAGAGRARMAIKKGKSASNNKLKENSYEEAKAALITAEASLWEAEHPDGLSVALNDEAAPGPSALSTNKKSQKNSPLWAWIGSEPAAAEEEEGEQGSAVAAAEETTTTAASKSKKTKKGKKKGSSATPTSTATGPTSDLPASVTKAASGPFLSAPLTISSPIRPTLKANLLG
ncbi:hypothetical protein V8E36_002769 [Tilletia maclaganii]